MRKTRDLVLTALFAALVAVGAFLRVPLPAIPFTLQFLFTMLAGLLVGSFVVEKIFTIPGLGREFVSAITNRDYMMIMGTTIFLAALVIAINVVVDILYKIIDPRIKLK